MTNEHNPMKNQKALEALSEDELKALEAHVASVSEADEKVKAAEKAKTDAESLLATTKATLVGVQNDLKAAQANQISDEERKILKTLEEANAAHKAELVEQLKTASAGIFTEEELNAKSINELTQLAMFAKVAVPAPDYRGRGIVAAEASAKKDYAPPDPYDAQLKALQAKLH
jgi:hypothetical protein